MSKEHNLGAVAHQFDIPGEFVGATPYGSGHINNTYFAVFHQAGVPVRYILQRINHNIFKNPGALMENIQRVTAHLAAQVANDPDGGRRVLTLIATRDGQAWHIDSKGNHWRAYRFIENAHTFDAVETTAQAFQAAKAFGQFQQMLSGLPAPRLHDTIPDFHHTPKRFSAMEKAVVADTCNRAALAKTEIEFALRHRAICGVLLAANLPERVTHNDTKINNVLLDDATGAGVCVVDLDTVMPGLALYDFGDMVRSMTNPAAEGERDLAKVEMNFPVFESLLRGYLSSAADFLTPAEKNLLPISGQVITFELGLRFLTDFLSGDTYFKVPRAGENLDRCRAQFKLFESIRRQEAAVSRLVAAI